MALYDWISGDGRKIQIGDIVYVQTGGIAVSGTPLVGEFRVVKLTRRRVRLERTKGTTGCWRYPSAIYYTKENARLWSEE